MKSDYKIFAIIGFIVISANGCRDHTGEAEIRCENQINLIGVLALDVFRVNRDVSNLDLERLVMQRIETRKIEPLNDRIRSGKLLDPWNGEYRFVFLDGKLTIRSLGRNGKDDESGGDDIVRDFDLIKLSR